ncbi:hypothetical protein [Flavobacterium sp. Root186]|uniref:hypothetical protein n=1 Tax=Flavobacterium sp. Root186 TaxID=1736485 RepID=UPI000700B3CF|nr:hypothetical protein [Flavobacterium sp. Root186]KRB56776.1 hypothetical protein ASD98_08800 [Flavobacterium sp. Root186]
MITTIDKEITKQLDLIKAFTNELHFEQICQFDLNENLENIPWNILMHPGLYLIEVRNKQNFTFFEEWVNDFKFRWENENYFKKFTPNFKLKRIKAHNKLEEWIPLYIGKSKNIKSRLHGHIYKELNKTTFAMKLLARENMKQETFRISVINLELTNYDAIIPVIENQLRNRINPLIGKQ